MTEDEEQQKWSVFIGFMIAVLVMFAWSAEAHMLKSVLLWVVPYFVIVSTIYSNLNDWPLEQGFFYAVDTGCSIGFGAFEETNDTSRAFTVIHILLTDSLIVFGLFQLFLDTTLKKSTISNEALQRFYRRLTNRHSKGKENKNHEEKKSSIHLSILLLLFYFFVGVQWGRHRHNWSFLHSLYFSVSALSSVGLETPHPSKETGFLRQDDAIFVGLYCLSGVPLMGIAMQSIASRVFTSKRLGAVNYTTSKIEQTEYSDAAKILEMDRGSSVGLPEFVVLEMLRLKKVDTSVLGELKKLFRRIDGDHDGTLTLEDLVQWGMLRRRDRSTRRSRTPTTRRSNRRRSVSKKRK